MKMINIVRRSGRSLRQAKARTLLTSLAIAVGAFTLTLALAAGEGARQYADKIVSSNVDPQALIVGKDKALFGGQAGQTTAPREYDPDATTFTGARGGGVTLKRLTQQDIDTIAKLPGVKAGQKCL